MRFFPDGCHSMVFTFGTPLHISNTTVPTFLPDSFLYGASTSYKDVTTNNAVQVMVVVFQPYGVHRLFGIPASAIKNAIIPLDAAINHNVITGLRDQLAHSNESQWKLIFDHFFTAFLKNAITEDSSLMTALDFIHTNEGLVTSAGLSRLGCSERQLERKFLYEIGISPFAYSGIVRMHTFLNKLIHFYPQESLTSLAYDAQYADQSHLIKSFKKITGITPTRYLAAPNRLARNFIEIGSIAFDA